MKRTALLIFAAALVAVAATPAFAAEIMTIKSGNVGINNSSPSFPFDVFGNMRIGRFDGVTSNIRFQVSGGAAGFQQWLFQNNATSGAFEIRDVTGNATPFKVQKGAPANLFTLTSGGQVQVKGATVHADFVFEPDYEILPIADHAEYMFERKHLPAVGAGRSGADGLTEINLLEHNMGILEELEVAHIYIAQLNEALQQQNERNATLERRLEELESRLVELAVD